MSTAPLRSLPPPQVPAELVAEARIRILEEECAATEDDTVAAILRYEIGAQVERVGKDLAQAIEHYRCAYRLDPTFLPPLLSLFRIHAAQPDHARLERVLDALQHSVPGIERATFLAEHALLLLDQFGQTAHAQALLEAALEADPDCQEAALMLEHHHSGQGRDAEAGMAVRRRARQVTDPALRGTLLLEVAQHDLNRGAVAEAEQALVEASELPHGRYAALEQLYYHALLTNNRHRAAAILEQQIRMAGAYAREEHDDVEVDNAPLGRFFEPQTAAIECAVLLRECACLAQHPGVDEQRAADRAVCAQPADKNSGGQPPVTALGTALEYHQDPLLWHEYALACEQADVPREAARAARTLVALSDHPQYKSAWLCRWGRAEAAQGNAAKALALYRSSVEADPGATAAMSALAQQLWAMGDLRALCDHLRVRAAREPEDRARLLLQAAHLALRVMGEERLGHELCELVGPIDSDTALEAQRLLYATASLRHWDDSAAAAADRILRNSPDNREQAHLLRTRYLCLRDRRRSNAIGFEPLRNFLTELMRQPACADWLPHTARVEAAREGDFTLLALAHGALSEARVEPALRCAHLCAAARASVRAQDRESAERALRAALALQPHNEYAVALLRQLLVQRDCEKDAMDLLRHNAQQQQDKEKALYGLLSAGLSAEWSGTSTAAVARYREALALGTDDPAAAWALLSLAERTKDGALIHEALTNLERKGAWPAASLLLAESCAAQQRFAEADDHARRALAHPEISHYAALHLWTYGDTDEARDAGLSFLRAAGPASPFAPLPPLPTEGAHVRLDGSASLRAAFQDARSALLVLLDPHTDHEPSAHARAHFTLSQLCATATTQAGLFLQGVRCARLDNNAATEPTVAKALSLRMSVPDVLETAIALDELVDPSGEPTLRLLALSGRLRPYGTTAPFSVRLAQAQERLWCGHEEDALREARCLVEEHREDLASLELLREAAHVADAPADLAFATEALAQTCAPAMAAALLLEAGTCYRERLGRPDDAERCLRRCLALDPSREEAFARLHDLLVDQVDVEGLLTLLEQRLLQLLTPSLQVDLHHEAAVLCLAREEIDRALEHLASLLAIDPHHGNALRLQAEALTARRDYRAAAASLQALAEADIPAPQRQLARLGAAHLLALHLDDRDGAITQLEQLRDEGLADLGVHSRLGELYLGANRYRDAVTAFRRAGQCERGEGQARFLCRAGDLLHGKLADPVAACASYREALFAAPTDRAAHEALQKTLATDSERIREAKQFMGQVQVRLAAQPLDPELLRGLRSAGAHSTVSFAEYTALDTLHALRLATGEERKARECLIEQGIHRRLHALNDEALRSLRKERDGGIGHELAQICADALASLANLSPEAYRVGRRDRVKRGPLVSAVASELSLFGIDLRTLYIGGADPHNAQLIPTGTQHVADWVLGSAAAETGLSDRQRFALGRAAMAHRLRIFAWVELSAGHRRDALVATAHAADLNLAPLHPPPAIERLGAKIQRHLSRKARRRLEELSVPLAQLWPHLETYVRAAELTLLRAGLMQCGKLSVALREALSGLDSRQEHPYGVVHAKNAKDQTGSVELRIPAGRPDPNPATAIGLSDAGLDLVRFWTSTRALSLHGRGLSGPVPEGSP